MTRYYSACARIGAVISLGLFGQTFLDSRWYSAACWWMAVAVMFIACVSFFAVWPWRRDGLHLENLHTNTTRNYRAWQIGRLVAVAFLLLAVLSCFPGYKGTPVERNGTPFFRTGKSYNSKWQEVSRQEFTEYQRWYACRETRVLSAVAIIVFIGCDAVIRIGYGKRDER